MLGYFFLVFQKHLYHTHLIRFASLVYMNFLRAFLKFWKNNLTIVYIVLCMPSFCMFLVFAFKITTHHTTNAEKLPKTKSLVASADISSFSNLRHNCTESGAYRNITLAVCDELCTHRSLSPVSSDENGKQPALDELAEMTDTAPVVFSQTCNYNRINLHTPRAENLI